MKLFSYDKNQAKPNICKDRQTLSNDPFRRKAKYSVEFQKHLDKRKVSSCSYAIVPNSMRLMLKKLSFLF